MVVIICGNVLKMITMSGKFGFQTNLQAKYWKNFGVIGFFFIYDDVQASNLSNTCR